MTSETQGRDASDRVTRIIDMRIPLPYLLSGFGALAFTLISMWFSLNQLLRDVADLQATVKAGNAQTVTLAGEQALLRFRMENLESEMRVMRQTAEKASPTVRKMP